MNQASLFRTLVVVEIALTIASVLIEFALEGFLPEELRAYVAAQQESPLQATEVTAIALGLPLLVFMVVAWVGLLRFWKRAPVLYLATWIGTLVVTLVAGPSVQTALGTAVGTAGSVVGGVILGMVYFSSLRDRFGGTATGTPVRDAA